MENSNINSLRELLASLKDDNIPPSSYQIHVDRFLSFKAREKGIPYSGSFELTPLCNLDCRMCYVHLTKEQMRGRELLSVDQWKSLMKQAKDAGMMKAKLTGGECLTYPGFDELYLYLHSMGVNVDVLTNGVLLDEKRIEFFKKHPPASIQVTLYGSCEDVYEKVTGKRQFSNVYDHIKAAAEADLPISLAITPNKFMTDDALKTVDAAQNSGVKYIINSSLFDPRQETGRSGHNAEAPLNIYIDMYKRQLSYLGKSEQPPIKEEDLPMPGRSGKPRFGIRCAAGMGMFEIDWTGRMYGCASLRSLYADPFKNGFAEAWESIHSRALQYPMPSECGDCAYSQICIICPAAHEQNGSTAHCNTFYCERVRRMVMEGITKLN